MNNRQYVTFVLLRTSNAAYGFSGYTGADGTAKYVSDRDDRDGRPARRFFRWGRNKRHMKIPEDQTDRFKVNIVDFLRAHPECEGSELNQTGAYATWFKELDTEKDAQIVLDAKKIVIEATNTAFNLQTAELRNLAIYMFGSSQGATLDQHKILEFAEINPTEFLATLNSPDYSIKTLIREGINIGQLTVFGKLIKWEDTVVGADEDDAVSKLMQDSELKGAIQRAIDKHNGKVSTYTGKKK